MSDDIDADFDAIRDAISQAADGSVVTKWFAVAETINADGELQIESYYPAETELWHQIGMLRFALKDREGLINHD